MLVAGSVLLIWGFFSPATTLLWGGIVVVVGYVAIGVIEARYSPILITPLSFYFLWYAVRDGLAPMYMSGVMVKKGYLMIGAEAVSRHDIALGYIIVLVGSLAFHFGLQMLRPMKLKKTMTTNRTVEHSIAIESIILLWAAGMVAIYHPSTFRFLGLGISILSAGPLAALLALAMLPAKTLRLSPPAYWSLLVLGTAGLVVVSLGAEYGSKATVMLSVTPLLVAALVRPRLRKYLPVAMVPLVAIYLLGVAPAINQSRIMPGQAEMSSMQRFVAGFKRYSPLYTGHFQNDPFKKQEGDFFLRMFEPTAVGYIGAVVRQSGLMGGATMSNLVYGFVPRILWPGKPEVNRGSLFTAQVGLRGAKTSTAMFAAGELYWDFGWAGVITGMWLLGLFLSGLWHMAGLDPRDQLLQTWLLVWLIYGLLEIPAASSYLIGLVYTFLFFGGLLVLHTIARQIAHKEDLLRKLPASLGPRRYVAMDYSGRE